MFEDGEVLAAVMASMAPTGRPAKILYKDGRVRTISWSGAIVDTFPSGEKVEIKGGDK